MSGKVQLSENSVSHDGGLGFFGATGLAITIVVGSGALVVPGIGYQYSGRNALWGWIISALLVIPLLTLFAQLGRALPGSAGIAGFAQAAFGRSAAAATEMLLMGTFGIGIPGIALTGGHYLVATGLFSSAAAPWGAAAIVIVGTGVNLLGARLSGGVQGVLAGLLIVGLLTAALCGLFLSSHPQPGPEFSVQGTFVGLKTVGAVFFAFTGWELVSFTTGEYRNPRRDFPRVIVVSYLTVVSVYLLLAWAVQYSLPHDTSDLDGQPIERMIAEVVSLSAAHIMAAFGVLIVVANIVGNLWAASRLAMSSSQEGLLPRKIGHTTASGLPAPAILCCGGWFLAVIAANAAGWISLPGLLILAGKNFLLLYLISALSHYRFFTRQSSRLLAGGTVMMLIVPVLTFGWASLAYAVTLLSAGALLGAKRRVRSTGRADEGATAQGAG